jgi:carbamoylphosphate synthase large subunit
MNTLILGGGHSEYPIVKSLLNQRMNLTTVGTKCYHKIPQEIHTFADYSNQEDVIEICKKRNIQRIIPGCNDFAAVNAALVAEKLHIKHDTSYKNALEMHNKDLWASTFQELSIPLPKFERIEYKQNKKIKLIQNWNPHERVIVKPVDMTGGKGIFLADISTLENNFDLSRNISRQNKVLVQEYFEGTLHSAFTIFSENRYVTYFADEEIDALFVVKAATMPSRLNETIKNEVKRVIRKYLNHLNLEIGIFHIQFIVHDDDFRIIDICARPPGDLFYLLPKYQCGFDFAKYWTNPSETLFPKYEENRNSYVVRYVLDLDRRLDQKFKDDIISEFNIIYTENHHSEAKSFGKIVFLRFSNISELEEFKKSIMS